VHVNQSVAEMATEVLARQAGALAERSGGSLEEALRAVLETRAGRLLGELRDGEHRDEMAARWQANLPLERAEERRKHRLEERNRLREEERCRARQIAWESFMRKERLDLELRKKGQLVGLLGEALSGESPAALRRLASGDRRQAEAGLVALASNGNVYYKRVEELGQGDMAARIAADRLRTAWLKERRDAWLDYGGRSQE
jgi:hypothetical protein